MNTYHLASLDIPRPLALLVALTVMVPWGCASSPIKPRPPSLPYALANVRQGATNAGRVRSIAVDPTNRNHVVIAMEFGGLWRTFGGGSAWFHIDALPAVLVTDVEFGSDGRTIVASVFRDNQFITGGGIYVSRDGGDSWARPATGMVWASPRTPPRTSAYSVSHAPDDRGLWYVGTDYGVAISSDNGATWGQMSPVREANVEASTPLDGDRQQDAVQSVLAMPNGTVLAMTRTAVFRSDDRAVSWRRVIEDNFTHEGPGGGEPGDGNNKMDRSPYAPWAFIFKNYYYDKNEDDKGGGTIWFYELDTETRTALPLRQGRWRGPFIRVSKDDVYGGDHITIWVGAGWDGYRVTRDSAESIRTIRSDAGWTDWVSFVNQDKAGLHADMGDMGVDGELRPAYFGSDGGIYKLRPNEPGKLMSAAVPGSGMNSLQIMDLAGTNVAGSDGSLKTSLYIGTQDNFTWASADGGHTWLDNAHDAGGDGHAIEVRNTLNPGEDLTVAFVGIGGQGQEARFADQHLANFRPIPNLDQNGHNIPGLWNQPSFFLYQQETIWSSKPSLWVRFSPSPTSNEVYMSENSGSNWHKVGDLNFMRAGEMERTAGTFAWVPVFTGSTISLVALTPAVGLYNHIIQTYDDSDVVRLPAGGSLGLRSAMWDTHAVFGVHPSDWKFLVVPDVNSNDVKVTRDGGNSWMIDIGLTKQVLRGGALRLYDTSPYRMQVTDIAFDPYSRGRSGNRIFVGTRDAGVICSDNDGRSWRTIKDSDKIKYITGFHFAADGGVYVSSFGSGLWYVKPNEMCPDSYNYPWNMDPPTFDLGAGNTGVIAREVTEAPPPPRGISDPSAAKLFIVGSIGATGIAALGPDNKIIVSGRNFPAGKEVMLTIGGFEALNQKVLVDKAGQFSVTVQLPLDLRFGIHTVEAVGESQCPSIPVAIAPFVKGYADESESER